MKLYKVDYEHLPVIYSGSTERSREVTKTIKSTINVKILKLQSHQLMLFVLRGISLDGELDTLPVEELITSLFLTDLLLGSYCGTNRWEVVLAAVKVCCLTRTVEF